MQIFLCLKKTYILTSKPHYLPLQACLPGTMWSLATEKWRKGQEVRGWRRQGLEGKLGGGGGDVRNKTTIYMVINPFKGNPPWSTNEVSLALAVEVTNGPVTRRSYHITPSMLLLALLWHLFNSHVRNLYAPVDRGHVFWWFSLMLSERFWWGKEWVSLRVSNLAHLIREKTKKTFWQKWSLDPKFNLWLLRVEELMRDSKSSCWQEL